MFGRGKKGIKEKRREGLTLNSRLQSAWEIGNNKNGRSIQQYPHTEILDAFTLFCYLNLMTQPTSSAILFDLKLINSFKKF